MDFQGMQSMVWMDLQGMQSNSWKWSNLDWNSSSSLTTYFNIPTLWSAVASSRNTLVLIPTLGNWQNVFDNVCLWKILLFFWEEN